MNENIYPNSKICMGTVKSILSYTLQPLIMHITDRRFNNARNITLSEDSVLLLCRSDMKR